MCRSSSSKITFIHLFRYINDREWLQRINALNNAGQYPRAMDLVSKTGARSL